MLRLQKNQSKWLKFILLGNELYIKFYFFLFKPKISLNNYSCYFSVNENDFILKTLNTGNLNDVYNFLKYSIDTRSSDFFLPHQTDPKTLMTVLKRASHVPLGIFYRNTLIGYALIRLLFPKTASYAIFISNEWQGRGIGTAALDKQLSLINELNFKPYSAVNKGNIKSLRMLKKLKIEFSNDLGSYFVVKDKKD